MRKLFAGTLAVSVLGALLVGGVYAWLTSATWEDGDSSVGTQSIKIFFDESYHDLLGPNGNTTKVASGNAFNNGDFDVQLITQRSRYQEILGNQGVDIWHIDAHGPDDGSTGCTIDDFTGFLEFNGSLDEFRYQLEPGDQSSTIDAYIQVNQDAPPSCMGDNVFYTVTLLAENNIVDN